MTNVLTDLGEVAGLIEARRNEMPMERSLLVGISGIDASGKGFAAAALAGLLEGLNAAVINADGWLNLPRVRFDKADPARCFYENALRLEEMFEHLVWPLRENRTISFTADLAAETAAEYQKHEYAYKNIDIILLEGIFLFKASFLDRFDLKVWVDCSVETALARAISRAQEGLPPEETTEAFRTIYFPAQVIHFEKDHPRASADVIFENDR